jgi:hypothetical protein
VQHKGGSPWPMRSTLARDSSGSQPGVSGIFQNLGRLRRQHCRGRKSTTARSVAHHEPCSCKNQNGKKSLVHPARLESEAGFSFLSCRTPIRHLANTARPRIKCGVTQKNEFSSRGRRRVKLVLSDDCGLPPRSAEGTPEGKGWRWTGKPLGCPARPRQTSRSPRCL